jgi:predicted DNA-binding protein
MSRMARNDPQVNLRMPADLKDRLDAAASENKRSLTAEIVSRLEKSWDAEGYEDLSELFLETLKDYQRRTAREVEEYRQMAGTVRLLRHIIERMRSHFRDIPEDIQVLLGLLTKKSNAADVDPFVLVTELVESAEREDHLLALEKSGEEAQQGHRKIEQLIQRLSDRVNTD